MRLDRARVRVSAPVHSVLLRFVRTRVLVPAVCRLFHEESPTVRGHQARRKKQKLILLHASHHGSFRVHCRPLDVALQSDCLPGSRLDSAQVGKRSFDVAASLLQRSQVLLLVSESHVHKLTQLQGWLGQTNHEPATWTHALVGGEAEETWSRSTVFNTGVRGLAHSSRRPQRNCQGLRLPCVVPQHQLTVDSRLSTAVTCLRNLHRDQRAVQRVAQLDHLARGHAWWHLHRHHCHVRRGRDGLPINRRRRWGAAGATTATRFVKRALIVKDIKKHTHSDTSTDT
jgi:hypothetical protein